MALAIYTHTRTPIWTCHIDAGDEEEEEDEAEGGTAKRAAEDDEVSRVCLFWQYILHNLIQAQHIYNPVWTRFQDDVDPKKQKKEN